jgi:CxxC motif-containing protein (DUF1111 family)
LDSRVLSRSIVYGNRPDRLPVEANVIEGRNPPTTMGLGLIDTISDQAIMVHSDPDDTDGDGVSGRVRMVAGQIGKYGWKANIPTIADFVADAMLNEMGITVHPSLSVFTVVDDEDECLDPELDSDEFAAIEFFLQMLAPPLRKEITASSIVGEELFTAIGCAVCHVPLLDSVPLFSDLLLHDIAEDHLKLVDQDEGLLPTEYRTAPLWGLGDTAPYLHDGSAPTIELAILNGHFKEAFGSMNAFLNLNSDEKASVLLFLNSI